MIGNPEQAQVNSACLEDVGDATVGTAGTGCTITYGAQARRRHAISGVIWCYDVNSISTTSLGGSLTIKDGSVVIMGPVPIPSGGIGQLIFPEPKIGSVSTPLTIILGAVASVASNLNIANHQVVASGNS